MDSINLIYDKFNMVLHWICFNGNSENYLSSVILQNSDQIGQQSSIHQIVAWIDSRTVELSIMMKPVLTNLSWNLELVRFSKVHNTSKLIYKGTFTMSMSFFYIIHSLVSIDFIVFGEWTDKLQEEDLSQKLFFNVVGSGPKKQLFKEILF